ncbi:MAG: phosphate acyltransferase PlsX [Rickettsiales bacterium]|jgi:glycerol-3-phosphate acyltransferase PlsX|nr:phosphate acyltransferase PlsX [Rickettsiales bacterium]
MSKIKNTFAIDGFGGDNAPKAVLGGLNQFLFSEPELAEKINFRIFGDSAKIGQLMSLYPRVLARSEVIHAPDVVAGGDKVREVIRNAKNTSMYMAIDDVRQGNSCGVISAGNTGVLMALSKLALKTLDGISRPAITSMLPAGDHGQRRAVLLDLGANAICDEENLMDFAILGAAYYKTIVGSPRPRVGLLNIGEEDQKGLESLRHVNEIFKANAEKLPFEYIGFVEGNDIPSGDVDVVVTDGFTGNIVLKTIEGTARLIKNVLKDVMMKSIIALAVSFLLFHVFKRLKSKIDPRSYAGAAFVGLNGFVVKTHGNSDALSFSNAVKYAVQMSRADYNTQIKQDVALMAGVKGELKK